MINKISDNRHVVSMPGYLMQEGEIRLMVYKIGRGYFHVTKEEAIEYCKLGYSQFRRDHPEEARSQYADMMKLIKGEITVNEFMLKHLHGGLIYGFRYITKIDGKEFDLGGTTWSNQEEAKNKGWE